MGGGHGVEIRGTFSISLIAAVTLARYCRGAALMTDLGSLRTRPVGVMSPPPPAMKGQEVEEEEVEVEVEVDGTTASSFYYFCPYIRLLTPMTRIAA